MRVLLVAACGERAVTYVDAPVFELLYPVAMQITLRIFREHLLDDAFLGVEVECHLV